MIEAVRMEIADFKNYISGLAVVTTILQFLSGVLVCKRYVANKTTAEATPLPFVLGLLSSWLWLLYGLVKHDNLIVLVNTIGVTLMIGYTAVFYIFTFKKSLLFKQVIAVIAFLMFVIGYISSEDDNELLVHRLGLLACPLTLLTVAAPLSNLFHVVRVKNTESLPYPMILMSFFVSILWFLYGFIQEDIYLFMPNMIGALIAISQLSLFVIYPSKPSSPSLLKHNIVA